MIARFFSHINSEDCICFGDRLETMILFKKMKMNNGKEFEV